MIRTSILLAFALTACVDDVGEGKVKASVEDVSTATAPATGSEAGTKLPIDASRSSINALGAKVTAKHPIDFHKFDGAVTVDGDRVVGLSFTVDVASLVSDNERLTGHLKNEDFLDVEKHPTATFQSASIEPAAGGYTVSGDLQIRGVTRRVSFPAKIEIGATEVTASTEFVIDRQDFQITYPGKADDLVQDNVALTISFVAPRT